MTDLRKAAEQALEALEAAEKSGNCRYSATKILREALAQPEQEPAIQASIRRTSMGGLVGDVCWIDDKLAEGYYTLYTTPPQREWQRLTDKEREEATGWSVEHIEAKLKEKNT